MKQIIGRWQGAGGELISSKSLVFVILSALAVALASLVLVASAAGSRPVDKAKNSYDDIFNKPGSSNETETPEFWRQQKAAFYERTKFNLSPRTVRILGGKYAPNTTSHLPFWFDFQLFKNVFKKSYGPYKVQVAHHRQYVRKCADVLRKRVLRSILAGVDPMVKVEWNADEFPTGANFQSADSDKSPVEQAIELVKNLIDSSESRNQIRYYLMACEELDGSALNAKLPY